MRKYPKLRYTNHEDSKPLFEEGEIVVQEKVDGSNFRFTLEENLDERFHVEGRDVVFGSRNVEYKSPTDQSKQFGVPISYIRNAVDRNDMLSLQDTFAGKLTFFGEAMLPHTLSYNFDDVPAFVGFDVYNESTRKWLKREHVERAFYELGLDVAPTLDTVPAKEFDDYEIVVPESTYGDVKAEGLAFKNYETQTFAKYVRPEFKEKNARTFGKPKKHQETGAEKCSYQYITNARIRKTAHKLIDEGPWSSLEMEMMAPRDGYDGLPQAVLRDMVEEEAEAIFLEENYEMDLGEFRSLASKRCARILQRMIDEESI